MTFYQRKIDGNRTHGLEGNMITLCQVKLPWFESNKIKSI